MDSFLQSPEWQEIQERMGRATRRVASALVIRHDLPFGFHYFYTPRPPALPQEFFEEATALGQETEAIFLKIDPINPLPELRNFEFKIQASHSLQPSSAVVVDCQRSEDEVLGAMHPKTRYNIHLAERRGVKVRPISLAEVPLQLGAWREVIQETARREGFTLHPQAHYRILAEVRSENFKNEIWFAELEGKLLAAAMVNWFWLEKTVTYLHGGSSRRHREVMAPHLLHWRIIQEAHHRGYARYDLGGIDEVSWPGLTRFKRGFGGSVVQYPPAQDIIFRPRLYGIYHLQRTMRHGRTQRP
ncbi:MAG: peptidoglycan bridge formation glycyltransferase FemA/FemB family protein [Patescibacteria group bacterium]